MSFFEKRCEEMDAYMKRDPAARNFWEIAFCSPGLHAVWLHRLNHRLWRWGARWLARFMAHLARFLTGVEIHPAAVLGERVFIDHGMGIVIGASAEIGDDCSIYQGVTLGGTTQTFRGKRHPTLEKGVIVGAGAKILGPIVVGEGGRVGSNAVVVKEVPAGCTAVGIPARILGDSETAADEERKFAAYAADEKSASYADVLGTLVSRVEELEKKLAAKEKSGGKKKTAAEKEKA